MKPFLEIDFLTMSSAFLPNRLNQEQQAALMQAIVEDNPSLIDEWQEKIQQHFEVEYAVVFPSKSIAYQALFFAASLNRFDRIIAPANAPFDVIGLALDKEIPCRLVDIDQSTGNMDIGLTLEAMSQRSTRGRSVVCLTHYEGAVMDVQQLQNESTNPNTLILEDASCATGGFYLEGKPVGCSHRSDATLLSFANHSIVSALDAACITTNHIAFYERLIAFRKMGRMSDDPKGHRIQQITGNHYPLPIQAQLALMQWDFWNERVSHFHDLIEAYRNALVDLPMVAVPPESLDTYSLYHGFAVQIDFNSMSFDKTEFLQRIQDELPIREGYYPIYRLPCFQKCYGDKEEHFPRMESFFSSSLVLPVTLGMQTEDVKRICQQLKLAISQ
ncbi:MAG: DegT/DnrJ/EryC1/StrS family aminotransferase [Parachlamydiales bacterium]|nr:DegT/DnrJ/EryC1/StrS family aminotransferase [Parachlamydiales bacterium]